MIGAKMRPSGVFPVVNAVTICSAVQLPSPVCLSGVRFGPTKIPNPGIAKPTSDPPWNLVMSGLPKKLPGVWQSVQLPKVTRYLPRATAELAEFIGAPCQGFPQRECWEIFYARLLYRFGASSQIESVMNVCHIAKVVFAAVVSGASLGLPFHVANAAMQHKRSRSDARLVLPKVFHPPKDHSVDLGRS